MKPLQIAIDGPVAAGKGDISARLAREIGLVYIYTGAMYRALALACITRSVPRKEADRVLAVLGDTDIDLVEPDKDSAFPYKVLLGGTDVTDRISDPDVSMGASDVSTIPEVRQEMVKRQQEIARGKRVVMEGRDIGLRVLPDARLKIYLTASLEERVKRRQLQWQAKGITKPFDEVYEETKDRDAQDMGRSTDPLQKLPDAWLLDSTGMTQEQVVNAVKTELHKRQLL
ncbi:(d)CMP kinase [Patescibacteria group bacterium]|nr:(d)CMP kinase [Patescibacteria group bacterium]